MKKIIIYIMASLVLFSLSVCNVSENNKKHFYHRIEIPENQFPASYLSSYKLKKEDFEDIGKVEQICNLVIDCHDLIKKKHEQDYLIPINSDIVQLIQIKSNNKLHEIDGNVFVGHLAETAKKIMKDIGSN